MLSILCTARDPSSANDILYVIHTLRDEVFFIVVADEPAYGILCQKLTNKNLLLLQSEHNFGFEFDQLRSLFSTYSPDILLTGVSSIGFGIDEIALLFVRLYSSIPSFSIQSYWGDVNYSLFALPDYMFVLDSYAAALTTKRFDRVKCIVSGPFQSKAYQQFDSYTARISFAQEFQIRSKSFCFFGQPLSHLDWYISGLNSFFSSLPSSFYRYKAFYRPHPKEDSSSKRLTLDLFSKYFDDYSCLPGYDLFGLLSGVDIAISYFSTIGYDCQCLNFYSDQPLSVPCYLFFDNSMKDWFTSEYKLSSIPLSEDPLSVLVDDLSIVSSNLKQSLTSEYRSSFHESVKSSLPPAHYQDATRLLSIFLRSMSV